MNGEGKYTEGELTFSLGYEELYKNLMIVHNEAKILDEDTLVERKISAYGHVLDIVGQLHSIALEEKEGAYAARGGTPERSVGGRARRSRARRAWSPDRPGTASDPAPRASSACAGPPSPLPEIRWPGRRSPSGGAKPLVLRRPPF